MPEEFEKIFANKEYGMISFDKNSFKTARKLELLTEVLFIGIIEIGKLHDSLKYESAESLTNQGFLERREKEGDYTKYTATEKGKNVVEEIIKYSSKLIN